MRVQEAVKNRILELCEQYGVTINKLAECSGVAQSALSNTVKGYAHIGSTGIVTIQRICQAFHITVQQFFDSPLFEELEYEPEKQNVIELPLSMREKPPREE